MLNENQSNISVFVYLCICVFVYLCICVFVYLCSNKVYLGLFEPTQDRRDLHPPSLAARLSRFSEESGCKNMLKVVYHLIIRYRQEILRNIAVLYVSVICGVINTKTQ